MKVRNGFITNSSSSSFLISLDKEEYDKYEKFEKDQECYDDDDNVNVSFAEYAQMQIYEQIIHKADNIIDNEKDLMSYLKEYYGYKDDIQVLANESALKDYQEYLKKITKSNKVFLYLDNVSDSSDLYSIIYGVGNLKDGPNIEMETC